MEELFNFIDSSPLLSTVIGGLIVSLVGVSLAWTFGLFKKKPGTAADIKDSQTDFLNLNKKWASEKRKLISKKAYEFNHTVLKNEEDFINDPEAMPLIAKKEWIPNLPIPIDGVEAKLVDEVPPSILPRTDILPLTNENSRFTEYHEAVYELIKPSVFLNNRHYRLQAISFEETKVQLSISKEANFYFNKIDYGKTAELEFTDSIRSVNNLTSSGSPTNLVKLPSKSSQKFRCQLLNSLNKKEDFADTVILGGVSTLTLILTKEGTFRFLMHIRSSNQGYAESTRHVVPAGEFQPLSEGNNFASDTNLLYNILREYAEEIEGHEEFKGESNTRFDYQSNPILKKYFEELDRGNFKIFYLGFGLDPFSLQGEHLTCAIFKEDTFNRLFGDKVKTGNDEGEIISDSNIWGMEFTKENIEDQYMSNILSAGEAILKLSERHLDFFKQQFLN
ncbi:MAG: hypothetical protein ACMZ7B_13405 [Balneola sp.]